MIQTIDAIRIDRHCLESVLGATKTQICDHYSAPSTTRVKE